MVQENLLLDMSGLRLQELNVHKNRKLVKTVFFDIRNNLEISMFDISKVDCLS